MMMNQRTGESNPNAGIGYVANPPLSDKQQDPNRLWVLPHRSINYYSLITKEKKEKRLQLPLTVLYS
jgi:hypothetical protein